jgi:Ca2+:H+ antiporter
VLGLSAVVGGLRHGTQYFDREAAGRSATMMILALVALSVPPLFAWAHPVRAAAPLESLSQAVAVLLLCVYFLAVYYSLYWDIEEQSIAGVHRLEPGRSPGSAAVELVLAAALVVWLGKVVVDNLVAARLALGLSEEFVAVIVLPLLTTVAGNSHALAAAWQNRMDVSVAVASGSATRTAMFLAPLLVFASSALGHPMNLSLGALELGGMLASALVAAFVAMDGQSSWIEGVMLLAVYVLEAVALLWWPAAAP